MVRPYRVAAGDLTAAWNTDERRRAHAPPVNEGERLEEAVPPVDRDRAQRLAVMGLAVFIVATATASTKHRTASVDVCVLLPDTKSSVRWVQFDAPAMKAAFAEGRRHGARSTTPSTTR